MYLCRHMVHSMTGYGKVSQVFDGKKFVIEIRSLNSKSLDLTLRMPPAFRELELDLRQVIGGSLDRGKVEFQMNVENVGELKTATINRGLAIAYYRELESIAKELNDTSDLLGHVLRMPEVMNAEKSEISDEEKAFILNLSKEACAQLNEFRLKEGKQLTEDFTQNINKIDQLLQEVPKYENERIEIVRERTRAGLEKIENIKVDENRLEQEIIFYIEKMDISEEKMRLKHHLTYFLETMETEKSGKKLGFIGQEIGREINTLGSKSYHAEMQKLVVDMKDCLEKIKEQVLNAL